MYECAIEAYGFALPDAKKQYGAIKYYLEENRFAYDRITIEDIGCFVRENCHLCVNATIHKELIFESGKIDIPTEQQLQALKKLCHMFDIQYQDPKLLILIFDA